MRSILSSIVPCALAVLFLSVAASGALAQSADPVPCDEVQRRINEGVVGGGFEPIEWAEDAPAFLGATSIRVVNFPETSLVLSCDATGFISLSGQYTTLGRSLGRWQWIVISVIRTIEPALEPADANTMLQALSRASQDDIRDNERGALGAYAFTASGPTPDYFQGIRIEPDLRTIAYRSPGMVDESALLPCEAADALVPAGALSNTVERRFGFIEERQVSLSDGRRINTACTASGGLLSMSVSGMVFDPAWEDLLASAAEAAGVATDLVDGLRAHAAEQARTSTDYLYGGASKGLEPYQVAVMMLGMPDGSVHELFSLTN
jgi:hypothetical protein